LELELVEKTELSDFFSMIYETHEGYAYLAFKKISPTGNHSWRREWYVWPHERDKIIERVQEQTDKVEVYFGPALYAVKDSSSKKDILGSRVLWAEIDGEVPSTTESIPEPTIRVRSSSESGHEHWYWKLDSMLAVPEIERVNRQLAIGLCADISGWDSTQVLRPPSTRNHKRESVTELLGVSSKVYALEDFVHLPDAPTLPEITWSSDVPDVNEVIFRYKFPGKVVQLFRKGVPQGSRSDGLMALGYHLAELQLKNEEILSMLLNADERWGKFKGRNDQVDRLSQIVSLARAKYPLTQVEVIDRLHAYGFKSLLEVDVQLEWVWQGLLQKAGFFLLFGPPGIGKTQFSLDFAERVALGQPFLEREVPEAFKIGFIELEMGLVDTKYFVANQAQSYTEEELDQLEKNLLIMPLGEPLYLNQEREQVFVEEWIADNKLDGVIFDSLGSTTDELSDESRVKSVMDWNDRIRQRHNCFTWFVHHNRKASGDNKKPNKLDDLYGNRYITARATTVYCLWNGENDSSLTAIPLKVRLAARPPISSVYRDGKLHFTQKKDHSGIEVVTKQEKGPKEKGIVNTI
jgi:hypothetical protein